MINCKKPLQTRAIIRDWIIPKGGMMKKKLLAISILLALTKINEIANAESNARAGKGKADPSSMCEAIKMAAQLSP